jgi:hypothetical protein
MSVAVSEAYSTYGRRQPTRILTTSYTSGLRQPYGGGLRTYQALPSVQYVQPSVQSLQLQYQPQEQSVQYAQPQPSVQYAQPSVQYTQPQPSVQYNQPRPSVQIAQPEVHYEQPIVSASVIQPAGVHATQYHKQDEYGNYEYGYNNPQSSKVESGNAATGVQGSYSYVDGAGVNRQVNYVADALGFRATGNPQW